MIFIANTDDHKKQLAAWASERLPGGGSYFPCEAVGVFRGNNELIATVIYNNFRGHRGDRVCEISMAAEDPRWATKENIAFILWYPLVHMDCRRITALTEIHNERVHKLLKGVGFVREGRHRDMFAHCDGYTYGMTRRWFLRSKWYGRQILRSLAA